MTRPMLTTLEAGGEGVLVAALTAPRIGPELHALRGQAGRAGPRWVLRACAYAYAAGWAGVAAWEIEDDFGTADRWPTHDRATPAAMRASDEIAEAFTAGARARATAAIAWRLADAEDAPDDLGDLIQNVVEEADVGAEVAVEVVLECLHAAGLHPTPRARELALSQANAAERVGWVRPSFRPDEPDENPAAGPASALFATWKAPLNRAAPLAATLLADWTPNR
jgi:hypothetical protein